MCTQATIDRIHSSRKKKTHRLFHHIYSQKHKRKKKHPKLPKKHTKNASINKAFPSFVVHPVQKRSKKKAQSHPAVPRVMQHAQEEKTNATSARYLLVI
jgi:hypothetical protein